MVYTKTTIVYTQKNVYHKKTTKYTKTTQFGHFPDWVFILLIKDTKIRSPAVANKIYKALTSTLMRIISNLRKFACWWYSKFYKHF